MLIVTVVNGLSTGGFTISIYTPIIFRDNKNSSNAKKNLEKFEIVNFLYNYLTSNFKSFDITFDTFTNDIRPFLWSDFSNRNKKIYTNVRYTSILDLKKIDNENFLKTTFFKNFSNTMRQQYRYSSTKKFLFKEYFSKEVFMQLLSETLEMQKVEFEKDYYNKILNKLEILNSNGYARMFCIFNEREQPINTCIFGILNNSSSYMYSARSKIVDNKNYSGIYLLINCFNYLKKLNVETVDLEGINSPQRGWFKLSFGGEIKNYYNVLI